MRTYRRFLQTKWYAVDMDRKTVFHTGYDYRADVTRFFPSWIRPIRGKTLNANPIYVAFKLDRTPVKITAEQKELLVRVRRDGEVCRTALSVWEQSQVENLRRKGLVVPVWKNKLIYFAPIETLPNAHPPMLIEDLHPLVPPDTMIDPFPKIRNARLEPGSRSAGRGGMYDWIDCECGHQIKAYIWSWAGHGSYRCPRCHRKYDYETCRQYGLITPEKDN